MQKLNQDNALLLSRIDDAIESGEEKFLNFLDLREQAAAAALLASRRQSAHLFFGGYDEAERKILCVYTGAAKPTENFPIECIYAKFREEESLNHRDFLGALLSLGIKKATIGDIIVGQGEAFIFILKSVAPLVLSELVQVGRAGVKTEINNKKTMPELHKTETQRHILSSLRLDSVISSLIAKSRSKASEMINKEAISVNFRIETKKTRSLKELDYISIKGLGRFRFAKICGYTKKENIIIEVEKFI